MSSSLSGSMGTAYGAYRKLLIGVVYGFAVLSGVSILAMMILTFVDVVLRFVGSPISGTYDIVMILAAITISGALPYTTAVKGHVAIEFFFQKLNRPGRIVMDTLLHSSSMVLFLFLAYQSIVFGNQLREAGRASMTLRIPLFWVTYVIALSSGVVALVILDIILHPGKEMIKP